MIWKTKPTSSLFSPSLEPLTLRRHSTFPRKKTYPKKKKNRHCAFGTKSHAAHLIAQKHRVVIWKRIREVEGIHGELGSKYGLCLALR